MVTALLTFAFILGGVGFIFTAFYAMMDDFEPIVFSTALLASIALGLIGAVGLALVVPANKETNDPVTSCQCPCHILPTNKE